MAQTGSLSRTPDTDEHASRERGGGSEHGSTRDPEHPGHAHRDTARRSDGGESARRAFADRRLLARASLALVRANVRYWLTVAPVVRSQLARWERLARQIPDRELRALALEKLHGEGFNAQVAAMVTTVAPARQRVRAVEATVALEVLFDYLDGLTEAPSDDSIRDGLDVSRALIDAVTPAREPSGDYYRFQPRSEDIYLVGLVAAVRGALASLPAIAAVREAVDRSAARCAEAQVRAHASSHEGASQVELWARAQAAGTALGWREFLAGAASSVLAVHALIAAATDARTTPRQALELDDLYLPICVMPTLLDSAIDFELDACAGKAGFAAYYEDQQELARRLADVAEHVLALAPRTRDGAHHVMLLVGVVAYYSSNSAADSDFARPVVELLHERLRPLITPTLAILHAWRIAKRLKRVAARGAVDGLQ